MRRSAQKEHDQEQREQMDKMRTNANGGTGTLKTYGTFDPSQRNNNGPDEMFEMFTAGPFQKLQCPNE